MPIPVVDIEFPLGAEGALYCPACGTRLSEPTEDGDIQRCPHLLFAYIYEIAEFTAVDTSVERLTTEALQERDDDVDDVAFVAERLERPGAVVFQVTTGGMACGPVWETIAFGLDLTRSVATPATE